MEVYFGEVNCQGVYKSGAKAGQQCHRKAYYCQNGHYYCGTHSQKETRTSLPKDPNRKQKKENQNKERIERVNQVAALNQQSHRKGHVMISKIKMMKAVEYTDGFYPIFPNFKHGNRKDGYGCSKLSPMSLGPVNHIMPNLPPAMNIENFHQFAKVFSFEVDKLGNPKKEYLGHRAQGYKDSIPHRHKYDRNYLSQFSSNVNKPLYSVFYDRDGREKRYTYFGCRYFYCKKYQELAMVQPEFVQLKAWLNAGVNLQIFGYDGRPVLLDLSQGAQHLKDVLFKFYLDTSSPFGHEFCLATLLVLDDPQMYPWNITYQMSLKDYEGYGI